MMAYSNGTLLFLERAKFEGQFSFSGGSIFIFGNARFFGPNFLFEEGKGKEDF